MKKNRIIHTITLLLFAALLYRGSSKSDGGDNGGLPENYPYERTTTNGLGEYGKSNPDATGLADLPTMQKVRQELWDMGSSKSSN